MGNRPAKPVSAAKATPASPWPSGSASAANDSFQVLPLSFAHNIEAAWAADRHLGEQLDKLARPDLSRQIRQVASGPFATRGLSRAAWQISRRDSDDGEHRHHQDGRGEHLDEL